MLLAIAGVSVAPLGTDIDSPLFLINPMTTFGGGGVIMPTTETYAHCGATNIGAMSASECARGNLYGKKVGNTVSWYSEVAAEYQLNFVRLMGDMRFPIPYSAVAFD